MVVSSMCQVCSRLHNTHHGERAMKINCHAYCSLGMCVCVCVHVLWCLCVLTVGSVITMHDRHRNAMTGDLHSCGQSRERGGRGGWGREKAKESRRR